MGLPLLMLNRSDGAVTQPIEAGISISGARSCAADELAAAAGGGRGGSRTGACHWGAACGDAGSCDGPASVHSAGR